MDITNGSDNHGYTTLGMRPEAHTLSVRSSHFDSFKRLNKLTGLPWLQIKPQSLNIAKHMSGMVDVAHVETFLKLRSPDLKELG